MMIIIDNYNEFHNLLIEAIKENYFLLKKNNNYYDIKIIFSGNSYKERLSFTFNTDKMKLNRMICDKQIFPIDNFKLIIYPFKDTNKYCYYTDINFDYYIDHFNKNKYSYDKLYNIS